MKTKPEQIEQEAAEVAEAKKKKFFSAALLPLSCSNPLVRSAQSEPMKLKLQQEEAETAEKNRVQNPFMAEVSPVFSASSANSCSKAFSSKP